MAVTKKISIDLAQNLGTGLTVYAIVRREFDKFLLDDVDGLFKLPAAADVFSQLAEDATIKGFYEKDEKRSVWADGTYSIYIYKQAGPSPVPASDTLVGINRIAVFDDSIASLSNTLKRIKALEGTIKFLVNENRINRVQFNKSTNDISRSINSFGENINRQTLDELPDKRMVFEGDK